MELSFGELHLIVTIFLKSKKELSELLQIVLNMSPVGNYINNNRY
jgi:hypothetical protein